MGGVVRREDTNSRALFSVEIVVNGYSRKKIRHIVKGAAIKGNTLTFRRLPIRSLQFATADELLVLEPPNGG